MLALSRPTRTAARLLGALLPLLLLPVLAGAPAVATATRPALATASASPARAPGAQPSPKGPSCPSTPSVGFGNVTHPDLDGSGDTEVFRAYIEPTSNAWHVAGEDGTGAAFDDEPLVMSTIGPVFPQVPTDVNGDGRQEAFVTVGGSGSIADLGLYALVGCDLTRVTSGGQPAVFRAGASAMQLRRVECTDQTGDGTTDIVQYAGSYSGNGSNIQYDIHTTVYTLNGGALIAQPSPPDFTITSTAWYSGIDCGPLTSVRVTGE